ncbi:uncharacterized protein PAC_05989 [Phialocephala subalpina]|uniref:Glycosyl hydrolase family 32 N-terminal domain-containing protein n=1 Tax=Phialocephala subalpina TaxID=576137 RepID=A0A1L7WTK8_9HELO|nr:uncharacterized protein PAC_05989 [Phialocephala subalpina]
MRSTTFAIASIALSLANAQYPASLNIPPDLDLDALRSNSLYLRWRPSYHVLAPEGQMNDPCGPMYDNTPRLSHLLPTFPSTCQIRQHFLVAHHLNRGMITWSDVSGWRNRSMLAISPSPYPARDWLGVFSGGTQPVNLHGQSDGNLTLMWTGEARFPDNWQKPYANHAKAQFIATTSDGGKTWQKYVGNLFLTEAPGNWDITGWRYPIFQADQELDSEDAGPQIPLCTARASDLTNWTFQGALFEPTQNYSFEGDATWTGNWGYNFDMRDLFSMVEDANYGGDGVSRHWIVDMGAENAYRFHPVAHWSLYAFGNIEQRANGSATLDVQAAGGLDWGNTYALNQFYDHVCDRRIIWPWSDEDPNNYGVKAQGFQGSLGILRESFILVWHHVSAPAEAVTEGPDLRVQFVDPYQFRMNVSPVGLELYDGC